MADKPCPGPVSELEAGPQLLIESLHPLNNSLTNACYTEGRLQEDSFLICFSLPWGAGARAALPPLSNFERYNETQTRDSDRGIHGKKDTCRR